EATLLVSEPGRAGAEPTGAPHQPPTRPSNSVASASRRERSAAGLPAGPPRDITITVIIPTYDRRAILRKTLLALSAQTADPADFEVVVVDDGSSDDTVAMLKQLRTAFRLRVL